MTGSTLTPTQLEFVARHSPALTDGDYTITVQQTISGHGIDESDPFFKSTQNFSVLGERFSLNPQHIYSLFPPPGSLGEHSNVLPHVILTRSTLPWERTVDGDDKSQLPWLALLLFDEEIKPKILTIKELKNNDKSVQFPTLYERDKLKNGGLELEYGQHDDDKLTVIDVKREVLEKILPDKADLKWLAHVRKVLDDKGNLIERAVVLCNRLPKESGNSIVHLVSLEGRYQKGVNGEFDWQGADKDDFIRLVSLKSWSFACLTHEHTFKELLRDINRSTLRLPDSALNASLGKAVAQLFLKSGFLPLPHVMREGSQTVSWYHGPLIPGKNSTTMEQNGIALPAKASDQLLRYNPQNGLFDISYAAAWELGRLLGLQSKKFSIDLFNWKRFHAQKLRQAEQTVGHLIVKGQSIETALPPSVSSWFERLRLLKNVPFNYLVPDERLLPDESLRFFYVDPLWMGCLIDGAFSIGRVTDKEHQRDQAHHHNGSVQLNYDIVTGILLRSHVVSGWPGLQVDASHTKLDDPTKDMSDKLPLLRMDRLSPTVLICLFEGELKTVDIHQKPEPLHSGFRLPDEQHKAGIYKKLRNDEGTEVNIDLLHSDIPYKNNSTVRVINMSGLATNISNLLKQENILKDDINPAQFALQMIEGVEKVRYTIDDV